jgi:uncharacterized protein
MLNRWLIKRIENYQNRGGGQNLNVECNFEPSCSHYAKQALIEHGMLSGLALAYKRIKRCNQPDLVNKINDPVPTKSSKPRASKN